MASCLTDHDLEQLAHDRLSNERATEVRSHLAACSACRCRYEKCLTDKAYGEVARKAWIGRAPNVGEESVPVLPTIEGYEFRREVRHGGQGAVYEAIQTSTRRRVALKILHGRQNAREASKRRFEREVELAASLRHPNIVAIHDSGINSGNYYFSMDYVDGVRLDQFVQRLPITSSPKGTTDAAVRDTLRLFTRICDAVNHAHQHGVLHRDLKPSNILVDADGEPRVTDFGLAKQTDRGDAPADPTTVSYAGLVIGTLAYMSPEQAQGRPADVDIRSDVYALGVILYELLTHEYPYNVSGPLPDTLMEIVHTEPRRPSTIRSAIDDEVETIILKALSKDKDRRYQTAGDLGRDIERYLAGDTIEAKRDSGWYMLKKTFRRYRVPVAVVMAFIAVLLGALVVTIRARGEADWQAYLANISAANRALNDDDVVAARKRLDAISERFRDSWEYRYVDSHLDSSVRTIGLDGDPPIQSVVVSPDRSWLAYGGDDALIHVWDLNDWREMPFSPLTGHTGCVRDIAIGPDGQTIVSASNDGWVRVWDASSGGCLGKLTLGKGRMPYATSVAIMPLADRIVAGFDASVQDDGRVAAWRIPAGETVCQEFGPVWNDMAPMWSVGGLVACPGKTELITGSRDGALRIWDAISGTTRFLLRVHEAHTGGINSVAVTNDGKRIVCGAANGLITVWAPTSGDPPRTWRAHDRPVLAVAVGPDGRVLASASADHTIKLWNMETGEHQATLLGHTKPVNSVAFAPDGHTCISASGDGTVRLWDAMQTRGFQPIQEYLNAIAVDPSGTQLAVASRQNAVIIMEPDGSNAICTLTHHESVNCVAYSQDGRMLVTGTRGDTGKHVHSAIYVWDMESHELRYCLPDHRSRTDPRDVTAVAITPDARRVVSTGTDGFLRLWDSESRKELHEVRVGDGNPVCALALDPTGKYVAVASSTENVDLYDLESDRLILRREAIRAPRRDVGNVAALAATRNKACSAVTAIAFAPGGACLAIAYDDGRIALWDPVNGTHVRSLFGHSASVRCLTFSPDGQRLVSGSRDLTIKLWDMNSSDEVLTLWGHRGDIVGLAFVPPYGDTLVSASDEDHLIRFWHARKLNPRPE